MCKVHVCFAVICGLHLSQNDQVLLLATEVTWDGMDTEIVIKAEVAWDGMDTEIVIKAK